MEVYVHPTLKVGLGGNHYVICDTRERIVPVCEIINKSTNSIYFSKKYNCFAIRVKAKKMKRRLLSLFL